MCWRIPVENPSRPNRGFWIHTYIMKPWQIARTPSHVCHVVTIWSQLLWISIINEVSVCQVSKHFTSSWFSFYTFYWCFCSCHLPAAGCHAIVVVDVGSTSELSEPNCPLGTNKVVRTWSLLEDLPEIFCLANYNTFLNMVQLHFLLTNK